MARGVPALIILLALLMGHGPLEAGQPAADTAAAAHPGPTTATWSTLKHVDTPTADLYVAETLTSARAATGAMKERFIGRPFWIEPVAGRGVRVAVIDTGIDPDHPDLVGSVVAWRDFLYGRTTPYDDDTHGTHVAGIIAAHGHAQWRPDRHYFPFGARGVAPEVDLIVAKAMDTNGDGDATDVAAAIRWALDPNGDGDLSDGAHVINLSIGLEVAPPPGADGPINGPVTVPGFSAESDGEVRAVRDAIRSAVRAGAIVVVAAGNHEPGADNDLVSFPGNMPEVITVAALDADGAVAAFSNRGAPGSGKPDLAAPGVLLSTFPLARDLSDSEPDGYVALGGTSMAAPMVAGAVALLLEADPSLRGLSRSEDLSWHTERVRTVLTESAAGDGFGTARGHGLLRVDAAVDTVDTGKGPVNWDAIGLLLLLIVTVAGLVVLRRRAKSRQAAVAQAKAEARARLRAAEDDVPDAEAETGAEGRPVQRGEPAQADRNLRPPPTTGPPPEQRAPWE